jgi:hypothetical protein
MELSGAFEPGTTLSARITYTDENDPRYQFRDLTFEIAVDRIEPELLFSYRWHPGVPEPGVDYSAEPTTLVEFTLADTAEGTVLTVVESGFDSIRPSGAPTRTARTRKAGRADGGNRTVPPAGFVTDRCWSAHG